MSTWMVVAVVGAALVYTIVRRSIGEPLSVRELFGAPVVLVAIGGHSLTTVPGVTPTDVAWLAGMSAVGLALGAARGATVTLSERDGVLWQRYPARTYAVWVVSLLVNGGLGLLARTSGTSEEVRPTTLAIGVGLLGEALAVGARALSTGLPFAQGSRR
jgi:hypothetical protein